MRVLVYGAGHFGRAFARTFALWPESFNDIVITDQDVTRYRGLPPGIRFSNQPLHEAYDVVVLTASAVPAEERAALAKTGAPIGEFWRLERRYNLGLFKTLSPWLRDNPWRLLILCTNPVHEWANALHQMFPDRAIAGFGTAFDEKRVRFLTAAMFAERECQVLRDLRVVGAHGDILSLSGGKIPKHVSDAAVWMSNALSVAFVNAPPDVAELWWSQTAIEPLVKGLAGHESRTHLIVPLTYRGTCAATGVDVSVNGLDIRVLLPEHLSDREQEDFVAQLGMLRMTGTAWLHELNKT